MTKTTLLPLLADGEFHSGEEFAQALGVSRTAVWKQLQRLTELGLELEAVRGRGYRILGGLELLDASSVRRELSPMASQLLQHFDLHPVIDSTNAEALRQAEAGIGAGYVCSAEQQTAGRGRRGRQWISPFARNLYLSLLWEFEGGAAALEGLSLAVGVAVTQALKDCGIGAAQLKWPNDILYDDAKLGGVLLEMSGDAAGPCAVVLGVGINVAMPVSAAGGIDQQWTDLTTANKGVSPGRNRVMAVLLNHLLPMVAQFETTGFAPWRDAWMQRDAFADSPVILSSGDQRQAGIARGVNERGALQLETSLGIQSIYGGEISMRPAADNA